MRQGEGLSNFYSHFVYIYIHCGVEGIYVYMFKVKVLLYADDIVIFGNSAEELQSNIQLLAVFCKAWKMKVNTKK